MKKLILIGLCFALCAIGYGSFTNSADNCRTTFHNAYAWSCNVPQDKATLWAQEVEAKLEGETAILVKRTVTAYTNSITLTAAQSGSVITMASTGTGVVTLPTAAAGLQYTIVDLLSASGADVTITAGSGDGIGDGAAAGSISSAVDVAGPTVTVVAIDTASWYIIAGSGVWG